MRFYGKVLLVIALAISSNASAASVFDVLRSEKIIFLDACEKILKKRLKYPSSYNLDEIISFSIRNATLEERMWWNHRLESRDIYDRHKNVDFETESGLLQLKRALAEDYSKSAVVELTRAFIENMRKDVDQFAKGDFKYVKIYLSYESENSFGTSLRSSAECTLAYEVEYSLKKALEEEKGSIFLNGTTELEWLLHRRE